MNELDTTLDKAALFFDVCAKIEGACADLYHYYSDLHRDSVDVSQMWKKTALEEENHQKQFELAHRLRDEVGFELNVDIDRACTVYQKLNTLLNHVRNNPPEINVALNKAIEMEEALADLHLDSAVHFKDESITQMFLALKAVDIDHVAAMKRCLTVLTLAHAEMVG